MSGMRRKDRINPHRAKTISRANMENFHGNMIQQEIVPLQIGVNY